ncbi:MAG: HAD family hydrolase, partial [Candidatus Adiutrix sp.]
KYFDTAVGVDDVSCGKPSPEMLILALDNLKADPAQTIYVGDALCDMKAAKAAGIKGLALKQSGSTDEDLIKAGAWQVRETLNDACELLGLTP